jgi:sugar transferase (PEP-CTERM system associated)
VFRRRVLVYGAGDRAARLLELRRRSDQRNFRIVSFVPAPGDKRIVDDRRVLGGDVASLYEQALADRVNEVVVAVDDRRRSFPVAELLKCKFSGIRIVDLLEFLERETGRVKVDLAHPSWLIFSEGFDRITRSRFGFRMLDLLTATFVFVVALPVMALVALAILIDDGRPILYRQRRVGLNGENFTLYKFRSMRKDAESEGSAVWADRSDTRATRVGRVLRKFRLDELPQLINVFKNEMSFVGPRPERPEFVEQLACKIPYYHERHYVKPGLTGWAQLSYPYGASEQDALAKLEYDMYYIKNRSLVFNLIILLQTAEVVLWQKGSR